MHAFNQHFISVHTRTYLQASLHAHWLESGQGEAAAGGIGWAMSSGILKRSFVAAEARVLRSTETGSGASLVSLFHFSLQHFASLRIAALSFMN